MSARPGAAPPRCLVARSERETIAFGRELGEYLLPAGCVLVTGDLGCGKTVLARGVAAAAGVDPGEVQSPTFTLVNEHHGRRADFVHADLYRVTGEEVATLGLDEWLSRPALVVIEWADRLPEPLPGAVRVTIRRRGDDSRELCWQR